MKRIAMIALLGAVLTLGTVRPAAARVNVAVGIGAPGFGAVITNGPVYAPYAYPVAYPVYGPPVYYRAPVVYPAAPYPWYGGGPRYGRPKHFKHFKHGRGCD